MATLVVFFSHTGENIVGGEREIIEKGFTKMTKTLSDVIKEGFSSLNKNN